MIDKGLISIWKQHMDAGWWVPQEYREELEKREAIKIQKAKEYKEKNRERILQKGKERRNAYRQEVPYYRLWDNFCKANIGIGIEVLKTLDVKNEIQQEMWDGYLDKETRMREYREICKERRQNYCIDFERSRISSRKSNLKKIGLLCTLNIKEWQGTLLFFQGRCCYCGEPEPSSQDHIIPVSKKGSYSKGNIVPACKSCNSSKKNKDFSSWYSNYKKYDKQREDKIMEFISLYNQEN